MNSGITFVLTLMAIFKIQTSESLGKTCKKVLYILYKLKQYSFFSNMMDFVTHSWHPNPQNFGDHQLLFKPNFLYFFFKSSKPVLTERIFVDWQIRKIFSMQKVNIKKMTADISLKKTYLVIKEILVARIPRMS